MAITEAVEEAGIEFDAVGGPTMGADALAVGITAANHSRWFFICKQPKGHGTGRRIEGAPIDSDTRVLLVDDVVTTGGSILETVDGIYKVGPPSLESWHWLIEETRLVRESLIMTSRTYPWPHTQISALIRCVLKESMQSRLRKGCRPSSPAAFDELATWCRDFCWLSGNTASVSD